MPKAKPVSLHPLSFDAAIKALMNVVPALGNTKKKRSAIKPKKRKKSL
ncbi:MAG: hypothetical protein ABI980_04505 [Nitrospirota bacterium]|jgi:hypothetical protein